MRDRPPKISKMIVNAIKNLSESKGSTAKEIMNFITSEFKSPESTLQRQMAIALQRGIDCGILKKKRGYYTLNDRIAALEEPQDVTAACGPKHSRRRRKSRKVHRRSRKHGSKCAPVSRSRKRKSKSCVSGKRSSKRGRRSRGRSKGHARGHGHAKGCGPKKSRRRGMKSKSRRRRKRSSSRKGMTKCRTHPNQEVDVINEVSENAPQVENEAEDMLPRRGRSMSQSKRGQSVTKNRSHSRARSTRSTKSRK